MLRVGQMSVEDWLQTVKQTVARLRVKGRTTFTLSIPSVLRDKVILQKSRIYRQQCYNVPFPYHRLIPSGSLHWLWGNVLKDFNTFGVKYLPVSFIECLKYGLGFTTLEATKSHRKSPPWKWFLPESHLWSFEALKLTGATLNIPGLHVAIFYGGF